MTISATKGPGATRLLLHARAVAAAAAAKKKPVAKKKAAPAAAASTSSSASSQKRVDPFSTGGEMQASAQYHSQAAQQIAGIDQAIEAQRADSLTKLGFDDAQGVHHSGTIDRDALKDTSGATDNSASRGLGRSSVLTGALTDIEAQRVINTQYVKDALKRAETDGETNKRIISQGVSDYDAGTVVQQAANAVAVNNTLEPEAGTTPPAASTPGVAAPPKPATMPSVVAQAAQAASGGKSLAPVKPKSVGRGWGKPPVHNTWPGVKTPKIGRT